MLGHATALLMQLAGAGSWSTTCRLWTAASPPGSLWCALAGQSAPISCRDRCCTACMCMGSCRTARSGVLASCRKPTGFPGQQPPCKHAGQLEDCQERHPLPSIRRHERLTSLCCCTACRASTGPSTPARWRASAWPRTRSWPRTCAIPGRPSCSSTRRVACSGSPRACMHDRPCLPSCPGRPSCSSTRRVACSGSPRACLHDRPCLPSCPGRPSCSSTRRVACSGSPRACMHDRPCLPSCPGRPSCSSTRRVACSGSPRACVHSWPCLPCGACPTAPSRPGCQV